MTVGFDNVGLIAEQMAGESAGDIVSAKPAQGWLATGWFTPDYRPLAERIAGELASAGAPYHLYGVKKSGNWSREVLRKASIVLRAMREHPNDVLVFMDVDCHVRGPIDDVIKTTADLSCSLYLKKRIGGRQRAHWSDRVCVIRPTAGARRLVERWALAAQEANSVNPDGDSETTLMEALGNCTQSSWSALDPRYAGREVTVAPKSAVIVHESAHEHATPMGRVNRQLKTWRRQVFGRTTRDLVVK